MAMGKRIKEAMDKRRMTQQRLAEEASKHGRQVSQAAISALITRDSDTSTFLFPLARALRVNPEWLQDGGDIESGLESEGWTSGRDLLPAEDDLLERFRNADPRWRLSLQLLAALANEDQIEVATDVNVIVARIAGKKPHELRPVGNKRMREILAHSPQGWPPRDPAKTKETK